MKYLIAKFGMTREDFAKVVDVPVNVVHAWCDLGHVSIKDKKKISRALKLSMEELNEYF